MMHVYYSARDYSELFGRSQNVGILAGIWPEPHAKRVFSAAPITTTTTLLLLLLVLPKPLTPPAPPPPPPLRS